MEKKLRQQEMINDLKKLITIPETDYNGIVDIFKKYAIDIKEAEAYISRYLPMIIKDIDMRNALIIFENKLNIYSFYLEYRDYNPEGRVNVENFTRELKKASEKDVASLMEKYVNSNNCKTKLRFMVHAYSVIDKSYYINKMELKNKLHSLGEEYLRDLVTENHMEIIKSLNKKNDPYYNFILELVRSPKDTWERQVRVFLANVNDEIMAKQQLLRIILLSKNDISTQELVKYYRLFENLLDKSMIHYYDPITQEPLSKSVYHNKYARVIKFLDELIKTSSDDKKRIIELFSSLSNDRYYGIIREMYDRLVEIFPYFHPEIVDYEDFLKERYQVYSDYRHQLKQEVCAKINDDRKEERRIKKINNELNGLGDARKLVRLFLDSPCVIIEEYKNVQHLSLMDIRSSIDLVKKYDDTLYQEYVKKQEKGLKTVKNKIKELLYYLQNGYDNRKFDIIDYYQLIKVDLKTMQQLILKTSFLNKDEVYMLAKFLGENHQTKCIGPNTLANTTIEINCVIDSEGLPIKGTGVSIPKKMRYDAVTYLLENEIPLCNVTYEAILKRYVSKYDELNGNYSKKN